MKKYTKYDYYTSTVSFKNAINTDNVGLNAIYSTVDNIYTDWNTNYINHAVNIPTGGPTAMFISCGSNNNSQKYFMCSIFTYAAQLFISCKKIPNDRFIIMTLYK